MRISVLSCFFLIVFCFVAEKAEAAEKKFTVVIDPGHGGKDPGAVGANHKEKDINLAVALQFGALLEKEKDVQVIYTRKTDVFVALDERPRVANKAKADLFISIHTNALTNKSVQGTETYVIGSSAANLEVAMRENSVILLEDDYKTRYEGFDPKSTESYIMFEFMQFAFTDQSLNLASFVQEQFKKSNRIDRGVRQAGFLVLRQTTMPSILIELGYISNLQEEAYLAEEESHKELALAIHKAFLAYKADHEKKSSSAALTGTAQRGVTDTPPVLEKPDVIRYRVQFFTSEKQRPLDSKAFKTCVPAKEYFEGKLYKYTYGDVATYAEAKVIRREVQKNFRDAFIVVFKNDKKLPLSEATPYLK